MFYGRTAPLIERKCILKTNTEREKFIEKKIKVYTNLRDKRKLKIENEEQNV